MIYGYVRVSTNDQNTESQKNAISRYCVDEKLHIDKWVVMEISSTKSLLKRGVEELIEGLKEDDVIIATELSRLSRSTIESYEILRKIVKEKKAGIIAVKEKIAMNKDNFNSHENLIKFSMFSLLANVERNHISERTKEGLAVIKARGVKLGKPVGCKQKTQYDKDEEKILHLHKLGVTIPKILKIHLGYGSYSTLKVFISKRSDGL